MAQVGIGPQFFHKSLNDYSNWRWALPREALQNSIDAPRSNRIFVDIKHDGDNTMLIWGNNGAPMSKEELTGKLLTLGESGKDFQGTVGGFGAAKLILLFAHLKYEIFTGRYYVTGSGGNYVLEEGNHYDGTMTKVLLQGDLVEELTQQFMSFVFMTQWHGSITVNGKNVRCDFRKGSRRREFEWGVVYANKSISNRMVVRMGGMPMFYRHLDCKNRCVLVELNRGNADVLQANRDSLKWDYQNQLDSFIDEITVEKMSAFRDTSPQYLHFKGDKLRNQRQIQANEMIRPIVYEAYATVPSGSAGDEEEQSATVAAPDGVNVTDLAPAIAALQRTATYEEATPQQVQQVQRKSKLTHEFVIKNTTGMEVPTHYLPHAFSAYSIKLAKIWAKVLLAVHELFNKEAEFSIGFVFDEEHEAQLDNSDYGTLYLINPAVIVKQNNSNSRSLAKRWKFTAAGRWAIVSDALHEFVHANGLMAHDELFSSKLTEMTGVVLCERQRFNSCFR